jgi:hypothetical protein
MRATTFILILGFGIAITGCDEHVPIGSNRDGGGGQTGGNGGNGGGDLAGQGQGESHDLAGSIGDLGTQESRDLANPSADMSPVPCTMSCRDLEQCVWMRCEMQAVQACVKVPQTCFPRSCSCITCPPGQGTCTENAGTFTCTAPGQCI